jgi:ABC-type nitrate/sulfonate/bicarbonate transport system substrate-binding protein
MNIEPRWKRYGMALAVLAGAAFAAWHAGARRPLAASAAVPISIAVPVQLSAGAFFVADQQQLFAQQGLAVQLKRFLLGKQALQLVLDGGADFAVVADTPFVLALLKGEPIATLATVYSSRRSIAIVGRRDSGVSDTASLAGKRVGAVLGTNAEFFLDTMLEVHGVERGQVQVVNLKPDELTSAFRARRVDAVAVWNPDLALLGQEFGPQAVAIYGQDLFVYRFLLVARQAYIDSHGAQVRQLLTALRQGNDFIKDNPELARTRLGAALGMEPRLLVHAFDPTDFTQVLDQSLLLTLSAQMRWAMAKGLAAPGPLPSYQDFVRAGPLEAVAPDANRIIR